MSVLAKPHLPIKTVRLFLFQSTKITTNRKGGRAKKIGFQRQSFSIHSDSFSFKVSGIEREFSYFAIKALRKKIHPWLVSGVSQKHDTTKDSLQDQP